MQQFTKITFNGVEYNSIDQMPPEAREQYQRLLNTLGKDADGDGIPDIFQKPGQSNVIVDQTFTLNGREYKSRDEMPPEVRELFDNMPKSNTAQSDSRMEIEATQMIDSPVNFTGDWRHGREPASVKVTFRGSWIFVAVLLVALAAVLCLWLLGVRPGQLFGR